MFLWLGTQALATQRSAAALVVSKHHLPRIKLEQQLQLQPLQRQQWASKVSAVTPTEEEPEMAS